MNAFQWMALAAIALAIGSEFVPRRRRALSTPLRGLRIGIFALAAAAIARPDDVTRLAQLVGIGRGADIVLYVLALAFVAVSFFLYAHQLRLRRDLSALAAHIAIGDARRGDARRGGAGGADERQAGDRVP